MRHLKHLCRLFCKLPGIPLRQCIDRFFTLTMNFAIIEVFSVINQAGNASSDMVIFQQHFVDRPQRIIGNVIGDKFQDSHR